METMRASLDKEPLRPIDAERTARTLSIHDRNLAKLRRQRCRLAPQDTDHDDDLPADLDDFRHGLARRIERLSQAGLLEAMLSETADLRRWIRFDSDFAALAHRHQEPPAAANNGGPWTTWLMLGGRGAGKTRAGAEWVRAQALGLSPYADAPARHIALVGETWRDVREVMIEGPSGLLRLGPRRERPQWLPSRQRLEWPNGAVALAFSAEDPEQLRGPQFDAAWCDELAKWPYPDAAFDMLQFGLRLGHGRASSSPPRRGRLR